MLFEAKENTAKIFDYCNYTRFVVEENDKSFFLLKIKI